jgi:hypothetical protein
LLRQEAVIYLKRKVEGVGERKEEVDEKSKTRYETKTREDKKRIEKAVNY